MDAHSQWKAGLPDEINFWRQWFDTKGLKWKEAYTSRLDPTHEFYPRLRSYVTAPEGQTIKVLDVGAGPLTVLGKAWPGRKLEIIAVDPLAEEYDKLISEHKVEPPVRTQKGCGESLTELFPENCFDLVYAENCLDHSYDPLLCLSQMLSVAKPGCYVATVHTVNEGKNAKYEGLHQWNFDARGWISPRFTIWRPDLKPIDVQEHFGATAEVKAERKDGQVLAYIKKRS